ncbi:zinc-finger-containing protein [Methylobacterium komagatae]|uniref:Zinc-finger-containing protein n=1 Tax=Methylobacterium komagatae TaxID=374425 RepID=A0ABW2BMK6_9HYPH
MAAPICPACGTAARLTDGREIYPHRKDLADKPIWACTVCEDTYVGCHPGTEEPLGFPADGALREARILLHHRRIDPLWKNAPETGGYNTTDDGAVNVIRKAARGRVYGFLAERMGLTRDTCHTAMFTLEQCREAWVALNGVTYPQIRDWAKFGDRRKPTKRRAA